ncbi:hypothetical protein QTP70_005310 [Hemibagrus guttatus]|uniref:Uncharacterized protein n=1 Tax=Hemibagrus guttatus TaxID=175788 RepID=A0AAE0PP72_9TELE|nr:hypothetical protein QTP70_005310 [Hemibagrus guttatus]
MGQGSSDYPKPHPEETPRDWMEHCGFGYYCTPFVDNLAGWSESIPQMGNFPRRGSFKPEYLGMAFRMIYEGQEDPGWNHPYTQESLQKWYDMKTIWDKYLNIKEHKALLAKMPPIKAGCKPKPPVPVRPPPYNSGDDEVYVDVLPSKCPGGKSTPNVVAPSVMSSKGKTVGASAPRTPSPRDDDPEPLSEEDDGLETDGPDTGSVIDPLSLKSTNAACIFTVQGGGKPTIYSPSASDLKDILDILPNPKDNPIHFAKTLIQTTRNAQLCGADYKFILMTKMGPMYDEDELVAKVIYLTLSNLLFP